MWAKFEGGTEGRGWWGWDRPRVVYAIAGDRLVFLAPIERQVASRGGHYSTKPLFFFFII